MTREEEMQQYRHWLEHSTFQMHSPPGIYSTVFPHNLEFKIVYSSVILG